MGMSAEQELYERMGLDFEILDSGCCGLAGSFGFEARAPRDLGRDRASSGCCRRSARPPRDAPDRRRRVLLQDPDRAAHRPPRPAHRPGAEDGARARAGAWPARGRSAPIPTSSSTGGCRGAPRWPGRWRRRSGRVSRCRGCGDEEGVLPWEPAGLRRNRDSGVRLHRCAQRYSIRQGVNNLPVCPRCQAESRRLK